MTLESTRANSRPVAEADYVIVGGGTAGCVLAARLSENDANTVIVLEAGPSARGLDFHVPAAFGSLYENGKFHWDYVSEPETFAGGQELPYKMGRVVGGSSAINGMVWVRGNPLDFEDWAKHGGTSWGYPTMEAAFRRIEAFEDSSDAAMGHDGPIPVCVGRPESQPLSKAFLDAARQAGEVINPNYNGTIQDGFCALHQNIKNGRRGDVYEGYLSPARRRPNLRLLSDIRACKIGFDGDLATEVFAQHESNQVSFRAKKEVVLCAGAIGSPQLLEVSGIGNRSKLAQAAIDCWHELAGVGENLHTHPTITMSFRCNEPVSILNSTKGVGKFMAALEWLCRRTGPAATNHLEAGAFLRAFPSSDRPDYHLEFMPLLLEDTTHPVDEHGFQVFIELTSCRSRGATHVVSADNGQNPKFRFNFLKEHRDIAVFLQAIQKVRKVAQQPAFRTYLVEEVSPGPNRVSDDELESWIRATTEMSHHLAGTCKLGAASDTSAVVDNELRVHGLRNLRVVDASIMPTVVSGNTHAVTIAIAENAARIVGAGP